MRTGLSSVCPTQAGAEARSGGSFLLPFSLCKSPRTSATHMVAIPLSPNIGRPLIGLAFVINTVPQLPRWLIKGKWPNKALKILGQQRSKHGKINDKALAKLLDIDLSISLGGAAEPVLVFVVQELGQAAYVAQGEAGWFLSPCGVSG